MKSKINVFIAIGVLIFAHSLTFGLNDSTLSKGRPATAWEEVDQTSGITFYERWVSLSETKQTRERKGVFYLDGCSDQILNSICLAENIEEWMVGAEEVYVIQNENASKWISYILYDAPWPYKNRELVASYQINKFPLTKQATVSINADTCSYSTGDGVRLESYEANWLITELEDSNFKIEFTVLTDTPQMAPLWIQDPIANRIFRKNLENFIEITLNASKEQEIVLTENLKK